MLPKQCPRCRAEAEVKPVDDGVWIGCSNRDCADYPEARFYETKQQAIRAWNAAAKKGVDR